jgi:hypothetical protein
MAVGSVCAALKCDGMGSIAVKRAKAGAVGEHASVVGSAPCRHRLLTELPWWILPAAEEIEAADRRERAK